MGANRDYDALADAVDREASTAEFPPVEAYFEEPGARSRRRANGGSPHSAAGENETPVALPGTVLDWATFVGREPPERQWIVPYWIPDSHVTLLAGRGGIGKSLLAQHLGTALAGGVEYMEHLTAKRVLMWASEDDADELWRRQISISSYLAVPFENLGNFRLRSCVGCDVTLAAPIFNALGKTPMLKTLTEESKDYKAELVILDNIARVFGGNENDRHQVTTFVAWIQAACAPAAVLLLGHPAKATGSEFSGSSAWEGAVRARLYFSDRPPDQPVTEDEFDVDPTVRYLSRRKANYSELDMRKLNLHDGVLLPEQAQRRSGGAATGQFCRDIVLRAVQKLAEKSMYGTSSTASPSYLPRLAKQYGLLENATESAFAGAMRQMVMDGALVNGKVGAYANRTPKMGLIDSAQMQAHK
ncbi:MAG: putative P-loop containing nucleotide triphosphate hydrolase superfamily protein [Gammaproteobacteria bacterium]|nr:putative P-loop containing nucleotide triphosphate hydrolase superfamily protein [Gammaproteobacteria bacterium]